MCDAGGKRAVSVGVHRLLGDGVAAPEKDIPGVGRPEMVQTHDGRSNGRVAVAAGDEPIPRNIRGLTVLRITAHRTCDDGLGSGSERRNTRSQDEGFQPNDD